jgi:hypothetical protein
VSARWNAEAPPGIDRARIEGCRPTAVDQKRGLPAMPKENDLEGVQDQGGKHGGQKGMPKPEPKPPHGPDQGIVRDEKGQEQPKDKARAQQVHRTVKVGR